MKSTQRTLVLTIAAVALLLAPLGAMATTGSLEPVAIPVALLLGAGLIAVAAYVASAVSLLGTPSWSARGITPRQPIPAGC